MKFDVLKFDVLHNFISPVTGRILSDYNYVLVGNRQGIAIPSPILIDIRLDLINLRKRYNTLTEADFVVGHPNQEIPEAQVLSNLPDGFVYNSEGTISTLPTFPQIPLCYAATTGDLGAIYNNGINGIGATLKGIFPLPFGVDNVTPSTNSIILVKDQNFSSQNGIYVLTDTGIIPPWILTRISIYDQPGDIQPGDIVAVEYGTVNAQTLWVETEIVSTIGTDPILFISLSPFNTLPENNIWIGNNLNKPIPHPTIFLSNLPNFSAQYNLYTGGTLTGGVYPAVETTTINIANLPDLTFKAIWRGNFANRPVEVQDLTVLEAQVTNIEDVLIPGLEAEIAALEAEIVALQLEVLEIQGQIIGLAAAIAVLQGQILVIQGQIAALNTRIDNLRLNNIPADGDVSLYGYKIINLADPINPQDAVNLRTLQSYIPSEYPITLIGDVIGSGPSNMPIVTTLVETLNNINNDGDVDINNFKLINITDPTDAQDAVNLRTLNYYIGGLALDGFIVGGPPIGGLFITTRGPTCLLTNIPAGGDINMDNHKITNLETLLFSNNASGSHYVGFQAGSLLSNTLWTLPVADSSGTQALVSNGGGILSWKTILPGTVTSVSGTSGQIDVVNGTTTAVISIDPSYAGQTSITTLGTVTSGTWNASLIPIAYGGTNASTPAGALANLGALPIAGGTMTGSLILNADPTNPLGAVTKEYADAISQGLTFKDSCYAATTANLTATYLNGVLGVGATLTNTGTLAAFSIDGVSPPLNARILIKNQSTAFQNGIYTLTTIGSGSAAWVLTRATDYNQASQIAPGDFILIDNGTVNANTAWVETATVTTIGTSSISFSQFGNMGTVTLVSGTSLQIDVANGTTTPVISIDSGYLGQSSITTLGTINTGTWHGSLIPILYGGTGSSTASGALSSLGGAPNNANYIIQTTNSSLPDAQVLASLSTGLLKNTTSTGVLSIGIAGTDYYSPMHPTTIIDTSASATFNVSVGTSTLFYLTTGSNNSAFGYGSLFYLTTGSNNSAFGWESGFLQEAYNNCCFFGDGADASVNNLTNSMALGYKASVSTSNTIILGNTSITTFEIPGINFSFTGNTIGSSNTNGDITIAPNGSGNILMLPSGSTGFVGINQSSPAAGLHVVGGVQNVSSEYSVIRAESGGISTHIELNNTNGGKLYEIRSNSAGTFDITDRTDVVTRITIDTNGYVGLGTNAPDLLLSVNGNADKSGGGTWATFSDERIKEVTAEYRHGLQEILQIIPKIYKYTEASQYRSQELDVERIGIVAQEIENIMPECVTKKESRGFQDLRVYDSSPLTYALINAVKELNYKIEQLEQRLS